jgi:hypothetical protein
MTTGMMSQPATAASPSLARLLVFFRKGESSSVIQAGLAEIQAATPKQVVLVDSLSWYDTHFAACGDWDSWALEAVTGKSYRSREPYFHGFVLTGEGHVGQGTAKVVTFALDMRKAVYWLSGGTLKPVAKLTSEDGIWRISTGGTP